MRLFRKIAHKESSSGGSSPTNSTLPPTVSIFQESSPVEVGTHSPRMRKFDTPSVALQNVEARDDKDPSFEQLIHNKEPRLNYSREGQPLDPTLDLLEGRDTYVTSGQFIRVKDEMREGVQSCEAVLLFCKDCIINVKMPNDLRKIKHENDHPTGMNNQNVVMDDYGAGNGSFGDTFAARRRTLSMATPHVQPVMRGSGNLRINANVMQGYSGITARKRCSVGWRLSYMSIHSIEASLRFNNMFTLWFYDEKKSRNGSNQDSNLFSRTYECEDREDRDEWVLLIDRLMQEYYQRFLEKQIIPAPEIYQFHCWVQKSKKKLKNPFRLLIFSNEKMYMIKMVMGEENLKNSKIDLVYPLECLVLKRMSRTPHAVSLQFDKAVLTKRKLKMTIDRVDFKCKDVVDMTNFFKQIALLYYRKTKRLPEVQRIDEELKSK